MPANVAGANSAGTTANGGANTAGATSLGGAGAGGNPAVGGAAGSSQAGQAGTATEDFVKVRSALVHEAGHAYRRRRALVDAVPDSLLRSRSAQASGEVVAWRASLPSSLAASG